jgi:hypothetical protein
MCTQVYTMNVHFAIPLIICFVAVVKSTLLGGNELSRCEGVIFYYSLGEKKSY